MVELMKTFGEQFGLVPLYAVIIAVGGFTAMNLKHLIMVMGIMSGIYITMFKAFNLKAQFGPLDVTQYIPVTQEAGNMITAVAFVYLTGFVAYGLKRLAFPQNAS